jgi:HK97 family phage major capsid protein
MFQNLGTAFTIEGMKIKKLYRAVGADDLKVDPETREFELSFASDYPVERYFGVEILDTDARAADVERVELGACPFLWNHDTDKPIGMISSVKFSGGRGKAKGRFLQNDLAKEKMQDAIDGLRNISFGYVPNDMVLTKDGGRDSQSEYLVKKYEILELSLVSIPADPTVGIGRGETEEYEVRVTKPVSGEGKTMEPKIEPQKIDVNKEREEARNEERKRVSEITALGKRFGQVELARQLCESGAELASAKEAILEKIATKHETVTERNADIGLTEKEVGQFSFLRAIQALANPGNRRMQEAAKFEFEVSAAGAQKRGKEASGIFVPYEVLRGQRDLSKGTPSAGGYLVATEHKPESFIELLRKKSALSRAGVRVLNGLVGDIAIPKQTGGATAYWVAEAGAPTESQQTFGQVAMSPKTVGAFTDLSRKLAIQSSPDVEMLVKQDLAAVLALAIDLKGLYGTGSNNEPLGIANLGSGLNTENITDNAPTLAQLISMETSIAADDADVEGMKYIVNSVMRGYLKSTVKFSSTDSQTLWEPGGKINGYDAIVSNQLTNGDIFFGNFNDMIMGYWSGLDLNVDTAALATAGGIRVIVLQDVDVAVRHAESFCFGQ